MNSTIIYKLNLLVLLAILPGLLQAQTAADEEIPIEVTESNSDPKVLMLVDDSGSMLAQVTHEAYNKFDYDPDDTSKRIPSLIFRINSGSGSPGNGTTSQLVLAEINWGLFGRNGNAWTTSSFSSLKNGGVPANATCNNSSGSLANCTGPGSNSPTRGTNTLALFSNSSITGNSIFSTANLAMSGGSYVVDSSGNEFLYVDYRRNDYARNTYDMHGIWPEFDASGNPIVVHTRLYATPGGTVVFNGREVDLSAGWYDIRYLQWIFYDATPAQIASLPGASRMDVVKDVLAQLISDNPDIEFGIATLNGSTYNPGNWAASVGDELWFPLGYPNRGARAIIRKWVGTSAANLIAEINTLAPSGGTPLTYAYIESLRYFGGERANDSNCNKGGNSCQYSSPLGSCSQGFTVVLSDGLPSSETNNSFKGNWVTDYDGDGEDAGASNRNCSSSCADYLDDAAYYAFNNDMVSGVDGMQNIRTYVVGMGLKPPILNDLAVNGGSGQAIRADTVDEITGALQQIVGSLKSTAVGAAGVAVAEVFGEEGQVFRPHASALDWSGGVDKYLSINGGLEKQFDMGEVLEDRNLSTQPRKILAGLDTDGDGNTNSTIAFERGNAVQLKPLLFKNFINGTLDPSYLADPLTNYNDIEATNILIDFIQGYAVDGLRARNSSRGADKVKRLGDVVHSKPIFVSASNSRRSWMAGNTEYTRGLRDQKKILLVGANDGMLHAFDTANGEELWAYIPSSLLEHLEILARTDYNTEYHRYFVDGQISVSDAFIQGRWRTLAMFGLAGGGSSYTVLDITDRENPVLLFERDDGNLYGESSSEPAMVMMAGPTNSNDPSAFEHYMVVGTGADKPTAETELVVYNLNDILPAPTRLVVDSMASAGERISRGLAVSNTDRDGNDDRIYFGSGSNLYRALLSGAPSTWTVERVYSGSNTQPISASPSVLLAENPSFDSNNPAGAGNLQYSVGVYFGTGRYEIPSDVTNYGAQTQMIAAIFDPLDLDNDTYSGRYINLTKAQLKNQSIGNFSSLRNDAGVYGLAASSKGFYVNLDTSVSLSNNFINPVGMVTHPPATIRGALVWATFLPVQQSCSSGGQGFIQVMNFRHGGQIVADYSADDQRPFYNGGIPDMDNDNDYDSEDLTAAYDQGLILPIIDSHVESVDLTQTLPYEHDHKLLKNDIRLDSSGSGAVLPAVSSLGNRGIPGPPSVLYQDGDIIIQSADIATVASNETDEGSDEELLDVCIITGTETEADGTVTTIRETISVPQSQVNDYLADGAELGTCPEDSDNKNKMTICHIPPGNPANMHTITVSVNAWPAHQAHGDTEGACDDDSEPTPTPTPVEEDSELEKPDQWEIHLYNIPPIPLTAHRATND